MTFTEAAFAVLKQEGRAMHSREIADRAVERGLLSHVGKTPVQTMSARLSAAVSKGSDKALFVRVRPGVFSLSDFGKKEAARQAPSAPAEKQKAEVEESPKASEPQSSASGEPGQLKKKKRRRRKKRTPAEGETATAEPSSLSQASKPSGTSPSMKAPQPAPASRPPRPAEPASKPPQPTPASKPRPQQQAQPSRPPQPERAGLDKKSELTNQIESFLRSQTRPVPVEAILERLGQKRNGSVDLVEAILVADGLEREAKGLRPRFIERRNGYTLAEREVSAEILSQERQIADSKARLEKLAERQVLRKLRSVSMRTFVKVMVVHLQRSGFEAMIPVERDVKDEYHLSVQDRRHAGRFRTAVVLRRDSADYSLPERAVIDLRGALHHYDATSGMIVTTGTLSDRAKAEALVPNLAPVALVDGEMLAAEMVRLGIGVRGRAVSLPAFDDRFFSMFEA